MEKEEKRKVELQQKLTGIQNEDAQIKVSLQKKEGEFVKDVHGPVRYARFSRLDYLYLAQNADELKTVKKISRAQGVEVHKLQSECIQFHTHSLRQGILLTTSYTDQMQSLKDTVKRMDAELQPWRQKESECASDSVCMA